MRFIATLSKKTYSFLFRQVPSWFYCKLSGLPYRKGYHVTGRAYVAPCGLSWLLSVMGAVPWGGQLSIGRNFACNNKFTSNSLGCSQPCFFNVMGELDIGDNVGISGSTICARTKVTIGNNVLIGSGCLINDSDSHPLDYLERRANSYKSLVSKPITICDDVFIGARSIILKGVTIGQGAVVGAGSVVAKDVEPFTIVAGNPARVIRKTNNEDSSDTDVLQQA